MSKKKSKIEQHSSVIVFSLLIAIIFMAFAYSAIQTVKEKQLIEKCLEIQDSPLLKYPCRCVPTAKKINQSDYVESRTDNFCTCVCDIGNNQTWTTEIRITK